MEITKKKQNTPTRLYRGEVKGNMKRLVMLICFLTVSFHSFAQLRTGLLVGGGMGFENTSINKHAEEYSSGVRFDDDHVCDFLVGYRFRFENKIHSKLFFDIDPLLKLQVFQDRTYYSGTSTHVFVAVEAKDINFQLAASLSANYKIVCGLYAGLGLEPTWNIVTEGKHFDAPVLGRIGYNINNKIDFAVTYRQGFTNTVNTSRYSKGRTSDLWLSIFIPFTCK